MTAVTKITNHPAYYRTVIL